MPKAFTLRSTPENFKIKKKKKKKQFGYNIKLGGKNAQMSNHVKTWGPITPLSSPVGDYGNRRANIPSSNLTR
ncbi:Uncharacterized protein TCM_008275 [Theobroma cacao]|uniref:Uncharacterized protein n=1 Tax=Theobroma cacao TaxID=3641 RepID=A0A061E3P3_THECC|nr:Uncharacterized protein TCM_008275 [Theobroma cacao]